jgi:hypothetical protein
MIKYEDAYFYYNLLTTKAKKMFKFKDVARKWESEQIASVIFDFDFDISMKKFITGLNNTALN